MKTSMAENEALKLLNSLASGLSCEFEIPAEELAALPQTVKIYGRASKETTSEFQKRLNGMSTDEVVNLNATDCNFFAQFMLGSTFKFNFPPALIAVWSVLTQALATLQDYTGEAKLALGIPRGFAKTTLMKLFCAYALIHSRHTFILIIGNVGANAEKSIRDIADLLDQPQVRSLYGDYDKDIDVDRQDEKIFKFADKDCVLKAKGQGSSVRGINIGNRRPDIILMDDAQDEDNARSAVESENLKDWILNTLLPAKSNEGGLDIFVGNTYDHAGAILPQLVKDPEWVSLVLGAILEDGTSLWERLHPVRKLLASYRTAVRFGNEGGWLAQYMNIMDVGRNAKFDSRQLQAHWLAFEAKHHLQHGIDDTDVQGKYMIIDPSSTSATADEHSLMLVYLIDDMPVCRRVIHRQMTPKEAITVSLATMLEENCFVLFVESVAYQDTLRFWFTEHLDNLRLPRDLRNLFKILPAYPERTNKNSRILNAFRQLNVGEVICHPDVHQPIINEGRKFDKLRSNNDDNILDTVHYAPIIGLKHRDVILDLYYQAEYRKKVYEQQQRLDKLDSGYSSRVEKSPI